MPRITLVHEFWWGDWFFGFGISATRGFLGLIFEKGDDISCIHKS